MEENKTTKHMPDAVPYIVYEGAMARNERMLKRLLVGIIISVILLFSTNAAWLYVWSQYDTVSYEQDGEGLNNICTGVQGNVSNGADFKNQGQEK